ncbi:MAG: 4-oxalomesaconate tautomerase [Reinekea sp.]|jgi:4-oxalomesaconate tautomerase
MFDQARCMWMRGGTSKGAYFLAEDLPLDIAERDAFLLRIMGSPDARQIDGMGAADPLTSKVAVVKKSQRTGVDVDYLFLQVAVDQPLVSDAQNCGNILAGVGPFAIERGLVEAGQQTTCITIFMENTGQIAVAEVQTPHGQVSYQGDTRIDGVPGQSSPIAIAFQDTAGSSCGALLPTGNARDLIENTEVTLIDNGMPVVILRAADFGLTGQESREELDNNLQLKVQLEAIRLQAGKLMNLGNVEQKTVPKMTLVSPATAGGHLATRTFIPHRCHASIGVLGAVTVATAAALDGSIAAEFTSLPTGESVVVELEHPTGMTSVQLTTNNGQVIEAASIRTARKLFDGQVFAN